MVHLQHVHETLATKGLCVLGFNCSDDAAIAKDLMRKKGVDYPTILDGSERAQRVFFTDYRGSGVPLNYVIDREGVIRVARIAELMLPRDFTEYLPLLDDLA